MNIIDLNCDIGEDYGAYRLLTEQEERMLMQHVSSVNIACGFHAGDPKTMRRTVRLALEHDVAIGAHPGLADLHGFGRRELQVSAEDVYELVLYQLGALMAVAKAEGGIVRHVKPHGALYNMAARNEHLAEAIVKAVYKVDDQLILYGLADSQLIRAAKQRGLAYASEVFADRRYEQDGSLTPRTHHAASITDVNEATAQVLQIITTGKVTTRTGQFLPLQANTICIHGDNGAAVQFARLLSQQLKEAGWVIRGKGVRL
ncbi:LamB/YcsF family protein [Paenibacillus yanchengensis]|uniref:5-oxoprolinase subunit A n=1 Tax=Paenibacillus yanchengensis TaxID=2035833 RepID=A0ABW4YF96_9BACL